MTIGGKKISLTTQIFVAMIIGSIAGLISHDPAYQSCSLDHP